MKHLYRLAAALIVLSFAGTAVFFMLAPDTVPVHYNSAGEIDRMGSKYEYIIFPIFSTVTSAIFLLWAKFYQTRKEEKRYAVGAKILALTGIFELLLFNGMGGFLMWRAAVYPEGAFPALPAIDGIRIASLLLGVLLIIFGNVMPKARKNALFGVRTSWSMSSDEVWRKSQRFGGFTLMLAGALLLADAMFLKGVANFLVQTAVLVIWAVASIAASCRYYKMEKPA